MTFLHICTLAHLHISKIESLWLKHVFEKIRCITRKEESVNRTHY